MHTSLDSSFVQLASHYLSFFYVRILYDDAEYVVGYKFIIVPFKE